MKSFRTELRRARVSCFVAQLACGLGWWVAVLVFVALLCALCDWAFVLSAEVRGLMQQVGIGLAALLLLPVLYRALRVAWLLPQELDSLNEDSRRTVACALKLPAAATSPLSGWLSEQARRQAAVAIRQARRHFPALRRWLIALLVPALTGAALIGLYGAGPAAFNTLSARMLYPTEDVPPYSSWRFILSSTAPQVHYGEDLSLGCRVEGWDEPEDICLLLRAEGVPVQVLPTFRSRDGSYVRVLEKVTSPCEVAFAAADGRARSHFVPVTVNYSPRILSGTATVTPLPYTGEPERKLRLGGSEILVPDGGSVTFELTTSTDIVKGYGIFIASGQEEPERLQAEVQGRTMRLRLPVRRPGSLELQVADADGREADAPVQVRLAVLPDSPPQVSITRPENGTYLVAGQPLELEVLAEDDYGLRRFVFSKALAPWRQHGQSVLEGKVREQKWQQRYDTAALGLRPGDKLELRAEVGDDNPFRFNIVSSPTTHVQIISEEEYAAILRMELSYEEFLSRYEALEEALEAVRQALESGEPEAVRRALEEARKIARTFAQDFPAFDMDGELSATAAQLEEVLTTALGRVEKLSPGAIEEERRGLMNELLESLNVGRENVAEQAKSARELALIARVSEVQAVFMQLVEQQTMMVDLFRRFTEEYGAASTSEPGKLEGLGSEQSVILRDYVAWEEGLSGLLEELTQYENLAPFHAMIVNMRYACESAGVEGLMDRAVVEAAAHQPAEAHAQARDALAALRKLLQNECSQQSLDNALEQCRRSFGSAAGDTLTQLLDALKGRRNNSSPSMAQGIGSRGGSSAMPNAVGSKLIGPQRSRMGRGRKGQARTPSSGGAVGSGAAPPSLSPRRKVGTPAADSVSYPSGGAEQVPSVYWDAVRSYFTY